MLNGLSVSLQLPKFEFRRSICIGCVVLIFVLARRSSRVDVFCGCCSGARVRGGRRWRLVMERRCPSYEAGFDASDPFGPVLDRRAGRVLRRRCRSEGIERSPYEDATRAPRIVPNKSHFTLNSADQIRRDLFVHECHRSAPENGDYIMAHEHARSRCGIPSYII